MGTLQGYLCRMWRASLTAESLLSVEELVEALPTSGSELRGWLAENIQPYGWLAGVPVYRWGDVLVAIAVQTSPREPEPEAAVELPAEQTTWIVTDQAAERLGVARSTLDEMLAQAPATLPGAPVQVGHGKRRQHWRWDPGRLDEWMAAYQAWQAEQRERRRPARRPTPNAPRPQPRPSTVTAEPKRSGRSSLLAMVKAK